MMIAMTSWRWWIKGDRLMVKVRWQELYRDCLMVTVLWQWRWRWRWLQSLTAWPLLLDGNYSTAMAPLKLIGCNGNCDGFMVTRLNGNSSTININGNGNGNGNCNCNHDCFTVSRFEHYCLRTTAGLWWQWLWLHDNTDPWEHGSTVTAQRRWLDSNILMAMVSQKHNSTRTSQQQQLGRLNGDGHVDVDGFTVTQKLQAKFCFITAFPLQLFQEWIGLGRCCWKIGDILREDTFTEYSDCERGVR